MSKFGAHLSIGHHDGLGAALTQCAEAQSPVPVIFAMDQNIWPDIAAYSPTTIVIFRTQIGDDPNPPGIWYDDPVTTAESWYAYRKPIWDLNHANYYAATNEPDPAILDHFDWLNVFELRLMQLADMDGLKLAIGAHSTGTPSDDGGTARYQKWDHLIPSMQYAKAHGHILLLHEYGFDTTLQVSAPYHALRHRSVLDYLHPFNADPPVVISECSDYNGYTGEGSKWLNGCIWYDQQVIADPRVLGFCGYQLGGVENWYQLIPQWADYVSTHPTTGGSMSYEFDHWHVDDQDAGTDPTLSIIMNANHAVTATFRPKVATYTLTVTIDPPGAGTVMPPGGTFLAGQIVELVATAAG